MTAPSGNPDAIRAIAQRLATEARAAAAAGDEAAVRIARLARAIADEAAAIEQARDDHERSLQDAVLANYHLRPAPPLARVRRGQLVSAAG